MTISAALSTNQLGVTPIPGLDMVGVFTITWDDSSLVTGEALDLTDYFSTIDAIVPAGVSAIELAGYVPAFIFEPGAAHTSSNLLCTLGRIPLLEIDDTVDIDPQPLAPANAVDIAALGTTQIIVYGKAA
jgi:hypothetical protein